MGVGGMGSLSLRRLSHSAGGAHSRYNFFWEEVAKRKGFLSLRFLVGGNLELADLVKGKV